MCKAISLKSYRITEPRWNLNGRHAAKHLMYELIAYKLKMDERYREWFTHLGWDVKIN